MLVVLSKALAFVLIILIGYICKRRGFFFTDRLSGRKQNCFEYYAALCRNQQLCTF